MLVNEFIEWLQTQDQGAEVQVLIGKEGASYCGDSYDFKTFIPEQHAYYTDFRGNQYAVGKAYQDARFLELGEKA